jgi:hypothetical protein
MLFELADQSAPFPPPRPQVCGRDCQYTLNGYEAVCVQVPMITLQLLTFDFRPVLPSSNIFTQCDVMNMLNQEHAPILGNGLSQIRNEHWTRFAG